MAEPPKMGESPNKARKSSFYFFFKKKQLNLYSLKVLHRKYYIIEFRKNSDQKNSITSIGSGSHTNNKNRIISYKRRLIYLLKSQTSNYIGSG